MGLEGERVNMSQKTPFLTRPELAERLGCAVRTVTKWLAAGMPVAVRGRGGAPSTYDEGAVRAWKHDRDERARARSADLMHSRSRKELAQAIEAEQRVAIRAGKLIPIEDVDRVWSGHVAAVRARLLAIPMALSDRLHRVAVVEGPAAVEALLQTAVYQVLTECAEGVGVAPPAKTDHPPAKQKRTSKVKTRPKARG